MSVNGQRTDEVAFVVRSLPGNNLKGAFRIHITPDALQQLKLKVGDVCNIIGEDGIRGMGIAWRAADKMGTSPKSQPVKMTETMRDTFGFKQGNLVTIERQDDLAIQPALKVMLTEITPNDYDGPDDNRWKNRCRAELSNCEGIAVGTTFDVSAGNGIKRRYYVEHIESSFSPETPSLNSYDDDTQLQILDGPLRSPVSSVTRRPFHLDARCIGGLSQQINELNRKLSQLCTRARATNVSLKPMRERGILLHGYQGTGKSLLFKELAKVSGLRKVIKLGYNQLLGTPSKNEAIIQSTFREAQSNQPSMILIDDLDQIASSRDTTNLATSKSLVDALDSIVDTQILLVCSARSPTAVHSSLLGSNYLTILIELPIPDIKARVQIISAQLREGLKVEDSVIHDVAALTHGFTGDDLGRLVNKVHDNVMYQDFEDWFDVQLPPRSRPPTSDSSDSRSNSTATTIVERPSTPVIQCTLADFQKSLTGIRPSALREIIVEPPKITFNDIGGSAALQRRFDRMIKWPLEHAEIFAALPMLKPRRGVLLYGPPGCSKTMTAQAVASSYGWNFIAIKGAELISMYVGESERALREIFRKARQAAPTIIFFDEIDSIAVARTGATDASKSLNVLTTLLNEMDGFEATKHVVVLAATNKPETLDPAILRPGRFDEHIYLGPPDADARLEILKMCITAAPGGKDINLQPIVAQTQGMSGAEIKNAGNIACELAAERCIIGDNLKLINQDLITGVMKTTKGITKEMLQGYEDFARSQRGQ